MQNLVQGRWMFACQILLVCIAFFHTAVHAKLTPRRFEFPTKYYKDPSGLFNPAAVWNIAKGWVVVYRWDRCFYQRCGIHHTGTTPLISLCGNDANAPNMTAAVTSAREWSYEEASLRTMLRRNSADAAAIADLSLIISEYTQCHPVGNPWGTGSVWATGGFGRGPSGTGSGSDGAGGFLTEPKFVNVPGLAGVDHIIEYVWSALSVRVQRQDHVLLPVDLVAYRWWANPHINKMCRLFNWKGEVYASHWTKFGWAGNNVPPQHNKCWSDSHGGPHSCEYTAISKLNFTTSKLELVHQFQVPILGQKYRSEKNWAFLDTGGRLTILYSLLPCTSVFTFNATSPKGAVFQTGLCYKQQEQILNATGLQLTSSRLSGNPVHWLPPSINGAVDKFPPQELLAMVHVRTGRYMYSNWVLRMDPDTLVITHISAKPVIQSSDYTGLAGYFGGVLIVGSFHVIISPDGKQMLRMFLGEGDQYSAWEELPLASIKWHAIQKRLAFDSEDEVLGFLAHA